MVIIQLLPLEYYEQLEFFSYGIFCNLFVNQSGTLNAFSCNIVKESPVLINMYHYAEMIGEIYNTLREVSHNRG